MDAAPTTRTCTKCGLVSRISEKQALEAQKDSFSITYLCPSCAAAKRLNDQRMVLIIFAAFGLIGLVLLSVDRTLAPGWQSLNIFFFELCVVLTILPHELGHAFMARAVGFEVF